MNRILSEQHGKKYAVIVNEFGEIGIDGELIVSSDEEVFEMNNGCICCTVRGDLIRVLGGLLKRAGNFDGILLETTGLADPAPVAQTFFADPEIAARAQLDSVVTVVDAKHLPLRLKDSKEAADQIAFADLILLNKTDLVNAEDLHEIEHAIHHINNFAKIIRSERCQVPLDQILGRGSFDLDRILAQAPEFLEEHDEHHHDHDCDCEECHGHHHEHHHHEEKSHIETAGISSLSLTSEKPINPVAFEQWIGELRATKGPDLLRYKGILDLEGHNMRFAVQGVHMMIEGSELAPWPQGTKRQSRLVFIGRALDAKPCAKALKNAALEVLKDVHAQHHRPPMEIRCADHGADA